MEYDKKVFYSDITRVDFEQKNNLNDLLNVKPATPIAITTRENETCTFEPRCDKYYIPKKKTRLRVKTVREIRNLFEQDNYNVIIEDMEKQQCSLFTKIRTGSGTDDNTKTMAKKMLTADHPISRTAWQMLSNVNPDKHVNPIQFVLWNGRRIRVVGSKGGKNKFISNHDLGKNNIEELKKKCCLEKKIKKKYGLLRDSLNIKFKPGPLRRKKSLDVSYQKYHMGPVELVKLPKPAVDIQPAYGITLEPVISSLLNKLRAEDGTITEKWAEFAVSVLGTVQDNTIVQIDKECCVTFDLSYKCDQDRIIMRRDIGTVSPICNDVGNEKNITQNQSDNMPEIRETLIKVLDSVEISLQQDCMYSIEKESEQTIPKPLENSTIYVKDKNKKKYVELDRLAVTVIQLPPEHNPLKLCGKSFCSLGCLCDSLNCTYKFKQHCGHFECMFGCKCELSRYKNIEMLENDCAELIPGLMKLDDEINANLAKEEQKFHQTVVVSGDKSILLKSRKRTSKSSLKYAEFYNSIRIKNEQEPKKILTAVCEKLSCAKIEPWCMVHNLYKCFCKGRFIETSAFNMATSQPITNSAEPKSVNLSDSVSTNHDIRISLRPRRVRQSRESSEKRKTICDDTSCARTNRYEGRKYDDSYYKITNHKISEMEKNDTKLYKKMIRFIKNTSVSNQTCASNPPFILSRTTEGGRALVYGNDKDTTDFIEDISSNESDINNKNSELQENNQTLTESEEDSYKLPDVAKLELDSLIKEDEDSKSSVEPSIPFEISGDIYKPIKGHLVTQEFLTPWIAKSYKNYKEQLSNGKSTLERPKRGKIILHLWECLLNRYRSRKNFFVTTKKRPFRIYIATQIWKPFFKDCVNIDAIRFSDLHKYPSLVKKLLTNTSNKDYFCILGGWDDCWEIIGSVKKNESTTEDRLSDPDLSTTENTVQDSDSHENNWFVKEEHEVNANSSNANCLQESVEKERLPDLELSKWFLMKLKNDFTEIYCHKKGFYVEREKILHAINLARVTRKIVVINKQTCKEITNIPFGIYALPDTNDCCAVVGPYEINESLGLEIVKACTNVQQNCTKGYWITTNKVDNIKVINDPMSFLPSTTSQNELCNITSVNAAKFGCDINNVQPSTSQVPPNEICLSNEVSEKKETKLVKPIKIRRTNGFYHLTSKNNLTKNISLNSVASLLDLKSLKINSQSQSLSDDPKYGSIANNSDSQIRNTGDSKTDSIDYSEDSTSEKKKTGMFILKPEEINMKISDCSYQNKIVCNANEKDESMDMDIENFLSSSDECIASDNNVLLISDEEDNVENSAEIMRQSWTDVWIKCTTIKNLGLIRGRRNKENLLSIIDFPDFEPLNLYSESVAFEKMNQVLTKRLNIPKHIKIKWRILTATQASKCLQSKSGLLDVNRLNKKYEFIKSGTLAFKPLKSCDQVSTNTPRLLEELTDASINSTSDLIEGLEETSRLLDDESALLWNETEKRAEDIIKTFTVPEELKTEMSETLQGLMTLNNDLIDV